MAMIGGYMIGSLSMLVCSLFYSMLTMGTFFSKKRVNSIENKIFSAIIIVNCIGLLLDISSVSLALLGNTTIIFDLVNKVYITYLLTWLTLFTFYTIVVSFNKIYYNKIKKMFIAIYILSLLTIIFLPLYSNVSNSVFYTYGPSASFMYGVSGVYVMLILGSLAYNIKNIKSKKFFPIITYIIVGGTATLIQATNPSVLVITSMETFITIFMYFTIENPDMKMIEELNAAKDTAEKANNAKTDFLSNMSHEIRTPLNAIVGFSQGLLEEDLPSSAKEEVEDIINASQSLLQIVNGILDISKIEANKLEIVNTEYSFKKVFDELVTLTKGRIGDKPLEFRYNYDHSIPPVLYGDHIRIKQIILNLLTNAVKYTKQGYVDFNISSVCNGDVCRLIISVEDSGIGIKKENINKLFNKFERFDLEKNITIEGTGLGLAITKKLVELMNGQIVVQSKYGEGSKFTAAIDQRIIPKTLEELSEDLSSNEDTSTFVGCGNKILVVDDNMINLKVAARLLKTYNVDVELVTSGKECINKILEGNVYELILLDDMMPHMTGVETLKNLQKIIGFNIPTVALTANAISGMREKYLENGFDDYLSKPIDKVELEKVLKKFLNGTTANISSDEKLETLSQSSTYDKEILISNGVDIDKSLELLGDMDTFNETLKDFLNESVNRLKQIAEYKNNGDMPNYAILVHAMKSDSKYLGFTKLAELSFNHEMASKGNDKKYVDDNYEELMNEANRIISLIKKYFGE